MKKYLNILFLGLLSVVIISCKFPAKNSCHKDVASTENQPYVVMLSMDGFRWDYADSVPTPNLDRIAKNGVKAVSMKPSFPSFTFPNHYSLATGLYPNSHGLVFNKFHCPTTNKDYSIGDRKAVEDPDFYGGEPIWTTAEKQGITTASFFWVGSETSVCGCQPTIWKKYQHNLPFEDRIDSVVNWLQLPESKRPHLITWYMHEPDATGHKRGPHSRATDAVVMKLDSLVGVFVNKIESLPNASKINIIILSDHGMCRVSPERWVILKDKVKESWVKRINSYNPTLGIVANEGCKDSIWNALQTFEHIKAWKSSEVPERLHFGSNPRIGDFVVTADSAWSVDYTDRHPPKSGAHGFDNNITDMHAIFYAMGPAFKKGYTQPTFPNVDVYPLIAKILNIKPEPTDGKLEEVEGMLK
ncbi:MAG: ectonucleotide pyrophosphatase/phosphodiesterase [Bacteroidales bacterium]